MELKILSAAITDFDRKFGYFIYAIEFNCVDLSSDLAI